MVKAGREQWQWERREVGAAMRVPPRCRCQRQHQHPPQPVQAVPAHLNRDRSQRPPFQRKSIKRPSTICSTGPLVALPSAAALNFSLASFPAAAAPDRVPPRCSGDGLRSCYAWKAAGEAVSRKQGLRAGGW